jgi:hypothetical protein
MSSHRNENLKPLRIVRTQDGKFVAGSDCYFPVKDTEYEDGWTFADKELWHFDKDEKGENKKQIREFLENKLGVKKLGKKEHIKKTLDERYRDGDDFAPQKKDIRVFMKFVEEGGDASIFEEYYIFQTKTNKEGKTLWVKPSQVYVDCADEKSPLHTGLSVYYKQVKDSSLFRLDEKYYKGIPADKFLVFLQKVGANFTLEREIRCHNNGYYDKDYSWGELEKLKWKVPLSRMIWDTFNSISESYYSQHRSNGRTAFLSDTKLCQQLRDTKWVPQKKGKREYRFVKPADAKQELLPGGFVFDNGKEWIQKVEFGKNTNIDKKTEQIVLDKYGLTEKKRAFIETCTDEELDEFKKWKSEKEGHKQAKRTDRHRSGTSAERNKTDIVSLPTESIDEISDFHPLVTPEDATVNLADLAPIVINKQSEHSNTSKENNEEEKEREKPTPKTKEDIAQWGEVYVAKKVLPSEFKDDSSAVEIISCNESRNQYGYDIVVKRNGNIERYIEVKTTTGSTRYKFKVSGTQWETGRKEGDKYWIYCVFNAGKENVYCVPIQNPIKKWKEGKLEADAVSVLVQAVNESIS